MSEYTADLCRRVERMEELRLKSLGASFPPEVCCGQPPMMRVRGIYVQLECAACGHKGGLAITEGEAMAMWGGYARP